MTHKNHRSHNALLVPAHLHLDFINVRFLYSLRKEQKNRSQIIVNIFSFFFFFLSHICAWRNDQICNSLFHSSLWQYEKCKIIKWERVMSRCFGPSFRTTHSWWVRPGGGESFSILSWSLPNNHCRRREERQLLRARPRRSSTSWGQRTHLWGWDISSPQKTDGLIEGWRKPSLHRGGGWRHDLFLHLSCHSEFSPWKKFQSCLDFSLKCFTVSL